MKRAAMISIGKKAILAGLLISFSMSAAATAETNEGLKGTMIPHKETVKKDPVLERFNAEIRDLSESISALKRDLKKIREKKESGEDAKRLERTIRDMEEKKRLLKIRKERYLKEKRKSYRVVKTKNSGKKNISGGSECKDPECYDKKIEAFEKILQKLVEMEKEVKKQEAEQKKKELEKKKKEIEKKKAEALAETEQDLLPYPKKIMKVGSLYYVVACEGDYSAGGEADAGSSSECFDVNKGDVFLEKWKIVNISMNGITYKNLDTNKTVKKTVYYSLNKKVKKQKESIKIPESIASLFDSKTKSAAKGPKKQRKKIALRPKSNMTCSMVKNCDEACMYFKQGHTELDKDRDGIPCNNLCKEKCRQ